jgi:hypothetical protein
VRVGVTEENEGPEEVIERTTGVLGGLGEEGYG